MERLQARSLEKCDRLQADILSIKQQKVSLARQIEQNHKDFTLWKKNRERELAQLRKQGRKQQMQACPAPSPIYPLLQHACANLSSELDE